MPYFYVLQTVIDSDATTYSNTSVGDDSGVSNGPVALSKAYSFLEDSKFKIAHISGKEDVWDAFKIFFGSKQ